MAVYGVNSYAANGYQWQQQQLQASASGSGGQTSSGSGAKSSTSSTVVDKNTLYSLTDLAKYAMNAMGVGANERVTFKQIQAYKEKLEKEYGDAIAKGLEKAEVSKDTAFRLTLDDKGKIKVVSDSPDRDKIQKMFDDNPELTKQYTQIQALADLDAARKSAQINPAEVRKRIQVESLAAWWQGEGNTGSGLGVFDGNYAALAGVNTRI